MQSAAGSPPSKALLANYLLRFEGDKINVYVVGLKILKNTSKRLKCNELKNRTRTVGKKADRQKGGRAGGWWEKREGGRKKVNQLDHMPESLRLGGLSVKILLKGETK